VLEDQEAVDLVRPIDDPKEASNLLVRRSLEKGSTDNITAMVVRFRWQPAGTGGAAGPAPEASRIQQGKVDTVSVTTHP
jgi:serine/threonine protein phosphatase PrpC